MTLTFYQKIGIDIGKPESHLEKAEKKTKSKKHSSGKQYKGSTSTTIKQRIDQFPIQSFSVHPNKTEHSNDLLCVACGVAGLNDRSTILRYPSA